MSSRDTYLSLVLRYIASQRQRQRRLNVRMLVGTLAIMAAAVPTVFFWHQHQLHHICIALLDYADRMESEQRWEEAANALHRYWKIRPEADALGRMAQNYDKGEANRDRQGVIHCYQRAIGMLPHRTDLRNRLSELLVQEGQYALALEQVEQVLARHPADTSAWKSKSLATLAAYHQGHPMAVEDVYSTLVQAFGRQPNDIQLAKALTRLIRDDMKAVTGSQLARQADQIMDRLVAASPQDAQCYLARYRYRTRHHLPDANHDLYQAMVWGPDSFEVVQQAAWDAHRDRDWLTARALFQHLIELNPDSADGYIGMGDVEIFTGRPEAAMSVWSVGRKRSVATLPLLLRLAEAQIQYGHLGAAQQSLEEIDGWLGSLTSRGVEHKRNWATTSASLLWGRWHLANGTPGVAIPQLQAAAILGTSDGASKHLGLKPVAYSARLLLGETYATLGQWEDAATSLEQALQLGLDSAGTMLLAAEAWGRIGQLQRALLRVSQALQHPKSSALASLRHAQLLFEQELSVPPDQRDWSKFESALLSARSRTPDSWELQLLEVDYHLKRLGPRAEHRSHALETLNSLAQAFPDVISLWQRLPLYYETLSLEEQTDLALRRLDELTSSSAAAKILRADVLIGRGRAAAAREILSASDPMRLSASQQRQLDFARLRLLEIEGIRDEIESELIDLTARYPNQTESIELLLDRRLASSGLDRQPPGTESLIEEFKRRQGEIQSGWQYYAARYELDASIDDEKTLSRVQSYLRSLETSRPHWSKTRELAGRIALRRGEARMGTLALEDAIRTQLADPQAYELLLRQYVAEENYQAIWRLLDQWMQDPPLERQLADGHWSRARGKLEVCRALAAMGVDPDGTLDELVFRLNSSGRSGDMIWLRMLLLKNGDGQQARQLLEQFLRHNPNDVAAWMIQLKQDMDLLDGANSNETLARIQSLDMQPPDLKPFLLGQAFQLVGLLKESQQAYRNVNEKSPYRLLAEIYATAVANRMDSRRPGVRDKETANSLPGHSSIFIPRQP